MGLVRFGGNRCHQNRVQCHRDKDSDVGGCHSLTDRQGEGSLGRWVSQSHRPSG